MQLETLGDFIASEMRLRGMSMRRFATFTGLNHQTVNQILHAPQDADEPDYPSIKTLIKLAEATHTPVSALLLLVVPASVRFRQLTPEAAILAQRIMELPEPVKAAIDALVRGSGLSYDEGASFTDVNSDNS
jgi:transcriptional regulator with XRE-family HTH domain